MKKVLVFDTDTLEATPGTELQYSFDEKETDELWLDGKKIYKKTLDCGIAPNDTQITVPTNIINGDKVVKMEGIALGNSGLSFPIPFVDSSDVIKQAHVHATPDTIWISTNDNTLNGYGANIFVTLYYTCTDR